MRTKIFASLAFVSVLGGGLCIAAGCAVAGIDTTPDDATGDGTNETPQAGGPGSSNGSGDIGFSSRDAGPNSGPSSNMHDASDLFDGMADASQGTDASLPGSGPGSADAGTTGPGPAPSTCTTTAPCTAAALSGSLSGDTAGVGVSLTGTTSGWFKIRVTENDDGGFWNFSTPMRLAANLTSPPGSNFDLFLYTDAPLQCITPSFSSTKATKDLVEIKWGERGEFGDSDNGADDSRDILVEVRYANGTCPPAGSWKLTMTGN